MSAFWHPFANMSRVAGNEVVIERGDGVWVYDTTGRRYLDGTASLWYCNVGYGRQEIVDAVAQQMRTLPTFHTFGDFANRPTLAAADRIAELAPVTDSKVFLTSGGSDSIDSAGKLARRYFFEIGQPARTVFLTREWAYHGMHATGTSLAGMEPNRAGHGTMIEDVVTVPWDSLEALEKAIDQVGADKVAALFCEPVVGAGGIRFAPDGYLEGAQRLIREAGGLFVADEVITGFGRLGAWFASERYGLAPDLITFAKGVTSGYLPMGGVIVAPRIAEPFWSRGSMWRHGYTYSGHAAASAAALANLDILERERLVERVAGLETAATDIFVSLLDHPLVTEVRSGKGLLAGIQIDPDAVETDPDLPARAAAGARDAGVITRAIGGGGLQVSPAFTITTDELVQLRDGLAAGLNAAAG